MPPLCMKPCNIKTYMAKHTMFILQPIISINNCIKFMKIKTFEMTVIYCPSLGGCYVLISKINLLQQSKAVKVRISLWLAEKLCKIHEITWPIARWVAMF